MSQSPYTKPTSSPSRVRSPTYPRSNSHKRSRSPSEPITQPRKKLERGLPSSAQSGGTYHSFWKEDESSCWSRRDWKILEDWYIRKHRDYKLAAEAFYANESVIQTNPRKELWSIEKILWKSKCLDTSAKAHGGLVPSERKRARNVPTTPDLTRTPTRTPNPTPVRTPHRTPNRYYSPS